MVPGARTEGSCDVVDPGIGAGELCVVLDPGIGAGELCSVVTGLVLSVVEIGSLLSLLNPSLGCGAALTSCRTAIRKAS